jgi:hypothetical protein
MRRAIVLVPTSDESAVATHYALRQRAKTSPSTGQPKCANGFKQETPDRSAWSLVSCLLSPSVALFRPSCISASCISDREALHVTRQ